MKTWLKRTLVVVFGTTVLVGGLTACGTNHHRGGWAMNDADITKMRERFIDRAAKELQLDEAQKAKLGQVADAMKAQRGRAARWRQRPEGRDAGPGRRHAVRPRQGPGPGRRQDRRGCATRRRSWSARWATSTTA